MLIAHRISHNMARSILAYCKLLLIGILLVSASCTPKLEPLFPDTVHFEKASLADRMAVSRYLRTSCAEIVAFRGLAKATISRNEELHSSRMLVVFEHPDRLRLELLTPGLNQPAMLITAEQGEISALDVGERVVYKGSDSAENIAWFIGVPLNVAEMMYWITARSAICQPNAWRHASTVASKNGQFFVQQFYGPDAKSLRFGIDRVACGEAENTCYSLRYLELSVDKEVRFSTSYSYDPKRFPSVPASLSFQLPEEGVQGKLELVRAEAFTAPGKISPKVFKVRFPSDAEVVKLD
jgi:outer membrane biogenesis lipoprotein LolB